MLKTNYLKIPARILGLMMATAAGAQVLIGGFQGPGDPTDQGWIDAKTGDSITNDAYCSFATGVVSNYPDSLAVSVNATNGGVFGYPSLELQMTAADIAAFNTNSWITFTFSVPGGTYTGGYSQIYNLALNASGYGYHNLSWTNALEMGQTNNTTPGSNPNYYFNNGANSEQTMVVTINYASVTNAIITNGEGYVQLTFQGNQGGGAPLSPAWYINSVVLSQNPFGALAPAAPAGEFIVDDFASSGVGPSNPTNHDYFPVAESYSDGEIMNVWTNWFGGAFSNAVWTPGVSPGYAPSAGSMAINLDWPGTAGEQFMVFDGGPGSPFYSLGISALTFTNFQCDVMFAPGSATNASGNFGNLQFGDSTATYGQDFFQGNAGTSISATNAGVWTHISIPLNAVTDSNLLDIHSLLIHIYDGSGSLNGTQTLYVDNIEFTGSKTAVIVPPPTVAIQKAFPGLRIFAGSTVNTYDREDLGTLTQNESWVGGNYPVSYSFSLLSYPANNINQTMLELIPVNTLPSGNNVYQGNEYMDYQASNGLWLVLAPNGGGAVTATVEWKTNLPNANPNQTAITITNSTALGAWTLTFNSASSGTLTAPGGSSTPFSIGDASVASDFANPAIAVFGLQPNSTAGEGLYEDWGYIGITNVSAGNAFEDFTHESSDISGGTTPSGLFTTAASALPASLIIARTNDAFWVNWTLPAIGFNLITSTNLEANPSNSWVSPIYFSNYNTPDETAPHGAPVSLGTKNWELLPTDDLPTIDGGFQQNPPAINDPPAPIAFFMLTTNTANIYPITP